MEALMSGSGSRYEGDIFAVLQHSPYIMRAFEGALADGAVDCTNRFDENLTFADRHWRIKQRQKDPDAQRSASDLLAFDVKSKVSPFAGDQIYITTKRQRRCVAFYIGICAADPSFVELHPNYHQQDPSAPPTSSDDGEVAVNSSRVSRFHPSAYRLDPCNSPYRMPLSMLTEAIARVRAYARGGGPYVNPWTLVSFDDWTPITTRSFHYFEPAEHTEQFTAYKSVMNIYRTLAFELYPQAQKSDFQVDFVGFQPALADFKITTREPDSPLQERQFFVQHKRDGRDRRLNARLSKVFVARKSNQRIQWYFLDTERRVAPFMLLIPVANVAARFDFLFYEFSFSLGTNRPRRTEFFFLPERVIPDRFYTSAANEQDFDIEEFRPFRFHMDDKGDWVQHMRRVVRAHPLPRKAGARPRRVLPAAEASNPARALTTARDPVPQSHGLQDYRRILAHRHRQFFYGFMRECASRGSGALLVLAADHPLGDFGFCHYVWSDAEKRGFVNKGIPPVTVDNLPAGTAMTPVYLYSKSIETNFHGPSLSSAQFRRLNSCGEARLLCIDLFGHDDLDSMDPVLVIPTPDFWPTDEQKLVFQKNLGLHKDEEFAARTPHLSSLLNTGLLAGHYRVSSGGPIDTSSEMWGALWCLFMKFAGTDTFEHPVGTLRSPGTFQSSLRLLNQRLSQEDSRGLVE
ncbi:hypothetical protein KCU81_g1792, partial [Aureobasidium melanogenum]